MNNAPIELQVEYVELPAEQVAVWRAGILLLLQIVMGAEEKAEAVSMVRLRVEQAIRRAGLHGLLVPALDELGRIDAAVGDMRAAVQSALTRLLE